MFIKAMNNKDDKASICGGKHIYLNKTKPWRGPRVIFTRRVGEVTAQQNSA